MVVMGKGKVKRFDSGERKEGREKREKKMRFSNISLLYSMLGFL